MKKKVPAFDRDGVPSLSGYTPPPEGEEEFRLWITIGIIVLAAIIIVPFLVTSIVPAIAAAEKRPLMADASVQQPDTSTIIVTYEGGPDGKTLTALSGTVTTSSGFAQTQWIGPAVNKTPVAVGATMKFSGDFAGRDRVIVVGHFIDGREIVISDSTI